MIDEQRDEDGGLSGVAEMDARGTTDLVGHRVLQSSELDLSRDPINNIIIAAKSEKGAWIEEATRLIGPARARFRSTYFHWTMAINGLHVAAEKYSALEWKATRQFTIDGARPSESGNVKGYPLHFGPATRPLQGTSRPCQR